MGSGKTTVSKLFQELGAQIIDADRLAKHALEPNYKRHDDVISQIREKFSVHVDQATLDQIFPICGGNLDRQKIGQLVFSNKKLLKILEGIIHPEVNSMFKERLGNKSVNQITIYDVPLLFESQLEKKLKATILVYTSEETAIQRVQQRTGLSNQEIQERIQTQISTKKKKEMADYMINNMGTLNQLKPQVTSIWDKIIREQT